jgi:UPF0271 protein
VRQLDLNADVGEGEPGIDEALIPLMSSVNIACGLHAGGPATMSASVKLALHNGVAIGAHPGYADREGFGRRPRQHSAAEVLELIIFQLGALAAIARAQGALLGHVKPHGALYNQAENDAGLAEIIVAAIRSFDPRLRLVGRAGSAMHRAAARMSHPFTAEAFADRRYQPDGSLLPRSEPGSVLIDAREAVAQVRSLVTEGEVRASDGSRVKVAFETLCLHGDTPGAPQLAVQIREQLHGLGVGVSPPRSMAVDTLPP